MSAILNREFQHPADGWYHIEVKGDHPNKASNVEQVIDDKAINSIVNRFNFDAKTLKLSHGNSMLIDHEHFKHNPDKETIAYGWLTNLQNRADGIYGKIRWTKTGQAAVDGGDYRFFSTEYDRKDVIVLNSSDPRRVRPMRLDGLTLTNDPNNKGAAPITNRSPGGSPSESSSSGVRFVVPKAISTPALDKWFGVVHTVQKAASKCGGIHLDYFHAWELARSHYPNEYSAAFGAADQSPAESATDDSDVKAATAEVAEIANRIRNATSADFRYGFNFVRENLPCIFNRMFTFSERVLNRTCDVKGQTSDEKDSTIAKNSAAKLFNRLVREEEISSGLSHGYAFQRVLIAEKVLHDLAAGTLTPNEAYSKQPGLNARLVNEIA